MVPEPAPGELSGLGGRRPAHRPRGGLAEHPARRGAAVAPRRPSSIFHLRPPPATSRPTSAARSTAPAKSWPATMISSTRSSAWPPGTATPFGGTPATAAPSSRAERRPVRWAQHARSRHRCVARGPPPNGRSPRAHPAPRAAVVQPDHDRPHGPTQPPGLGPSARRSSGVHRSPRIHRPAAPAPYLGWP